MLWWTLLQLKSSNWQTRAAAAGRLQRSNQRRGVPALIKALNDEHPQVRLAVIHALEILAHPAAAEALANALATSGRRPKGTGGDSANAEYEALAAALGALQGAAVPSLLRLLDSDDRETRRWAAHALGLTRDQRGIEPLTKLLADSRSEVRKASALALGAIGRPQALGPLVKALKNRDHETRRAAAAALGAIGDDRAVDALCDIAGDPNEPVQLAVVEALHKIGGLRAGAGLRAIADGGRKNVREAAIAALRLLEITAETAEERAAAAVIKGDFASAAGEGAAAATALLTTLGSKDPDRRRQAAETLGRLGLPEAIRPLLDSVKDHDPAVRDAAARALISTGPTALDGLAGLLSHHDPAVQILAARCLGEIGDPRSAGALALLIEQNPFIRSEYLESIDALRAAGEALAGILARNAAAISDGDLQRVAGLPDAHVQGSLKNMQGPAVDCSQIRERALQELSRRGC